METFWPTILDVGVSPELGLVASSNGRSLSAWTRKDGSVWGEVFETPEVYRIILYNLCEFEFNRLGGRVKCIYAARISEKDVRHLFEVNIVPLILGLRGRSVFHGSSVRIGQAGVVLLGASGQGKSTLTASFAMNGYPFLSDDVVVIDPLDPPVAHSNSGAIRLWQTSVDALFPISPKSELYASYSSKRCVFSDTSLDHATGATPIVAAFVLGGETDGPVTVVRIEGSAAHRHWLNNMFVLDVTRDDVMPHLFRSAAKVASAVPTYLIEYPRDFKKLPDVRQQILETVKSA